MSTAKPRRTRIPHQDRVEHLRFLVLTAREEISRADQKAALLLASSGVATGVLLAALLAHQWTPAELTPYARWLWWLGIVAAAASLIALVDTVYPRTPPKDDTATTHVTCPSAHLAAQHTALSHIVVRKYQSIKIAIWSAAAATACITMAILLNQGLSH
jgi:hypothetical protein